jgi:hypothetical protein
MQSSLLCLLTLLAAAGQARPGVASGETSTAQWARALAQEIAPRVEEIRGLRFRRPVSVELVDAESARAHFQRRAAKMWPEHEVRLDQRVYAQLGLLPAGTDLLKSLLDLLAEQAWGYYDPDSDTFFVLENSPPETAPLLMAHELTHALDDQHHQIDSMLDQVREDDDRATALSAVVEGSGTLVMTAFMLEEIRAGRMKRDVLEHFQESDAGRAETLRAAPAFLRRSLLAPYLLGLGFLLRGDPHRLSESGVDPRDLDRAFRDPPLSSEQILHPEKYWDETRQDVPLPVTLPDLSPDLGEGWSLVGTGTLGELALAQLAGSEGPDLASPDASAPAHWTNEAARGIAGDLYQHYVNGDRSLTVLGTLWDTVRDAREFRLSLSHGSVFLRGSAVLVLAGDLGAGAERLASLALSGLTAASPPGDARPR